MILNTPNKNWENTYKPLSYVSMYPQYFYPARYPVRDAYVVNDLAYSHKEQFIGTGLEDLMFKRGEIIDSKIQMLVSDIFKREVLQKDNLYHINLDQCTCRNLIYRMDEDIWDRKRVDMERKIIDLEQEKRMEQTSYFRDILFLKKDLREAMVEKLEENQKTDMLLGQKEELTCDT